MPQETVRAQVITHEEAWVHDMDDYRPELWEPTAPHSKERCQSHLSLPIPPHISLLPRPFIPVTLIHSMLSLPPRPLVPFIHDHHSSTLCTPSLCTHLCPRIYPPRLFLAEQSTSIPTPLPCHCVLKFGQVLKKEKERGPLEHSPLATCTTEFG